MLVIRRAHPFISLSLSLSLSLSHLSVMAMHAQHPSNAFSRDFGGRSPNDIMEELRILQGRGHHHHHQIGGTALSDHPKSELTCNASVSKKRTRDESSSMPISSHPNQAFPTGMQSRVYGSAGTSTSGRPAAVSETTGADLVSLLCNQSVDIDALVRLQTERLRWGLEEARKRHCRALLSVVENQVSERLKEKEIDLASARRTNIELEEKVNQMAMETQIWFNVAKNNEAVATNLRATLEQVLHQNNNQAAKEGYGESDGNGIPFPADDAVSCCFEEADEEKKVAAVRAENEQLRCQRACRLCREREVCVLLLPCRHLCLCKDCEPKLDKCPVCHSTKNACIQVSMS